jgi:hypothetical protein
VFILKRLPQFAGPLGVLVLAALAPLALGQATQVSHEGGVWTQVTTGSLSAVKNLRVQIDAGAVVVRGTQRQGIDYSFHMRAKGSSEEDAKHQFQSYKVSAYVKGDTAWVVGEWKGGHRVRLEPGYLRVDRGDHALSGGLVINIPRDTELVRIDTGGGGVDASGVAGQVKIVSGGGSVRVDDIGGSADLETGGDAIDV